MNPKAAKKPRLTRGGEHTGKRKYDFNISENESGTGYRIGITVSFVIRIAKCCYVDCENTATICLWWT